MPNTLQDFLAAATKKSATELVTALLRIPEDKRGWSPDGKARTALDQVAECALLNGYTADLIQTRKWAITNFEDFFREKTEVAAQDWEKTNALLEENTRRLIDAIRAVPDEALTVPIEMPWETQSLAEVLDYPYWNMSYHQGQINYIAALLGCLD